MEVFEPHFRRNYIHISDIFNAFKFSINNFDKVNGEIYNLGLSEANLTKEQLCKEIQKIVKLVGISSPPFPSFPPPSLPYVP